MLMTVPVCLVRYLKRLFARLSGLYSHQTKFAVCVYHGIIIGRRKGRNDTMPTFDIVRHLPAACPLTVEEVRNDLMRLDRLRYDGARHAAGCRAPLTWFTASPTSACYDAQLPPRTPPARPLPNGAISEAHRRCVTSVVPPTRRL